MSSHHTQGQSHDRISGEDEMYQLEPHVQAPVNRSVVDSDPSLVQKMLSAVSGSVATSFLVTPLDVVRVRLQAQKSPSSTRLPSFLQLPPNLGVTACCREVFWVHNQSQFCVAAPSPGVVRYEAIVSDCAAEETQRRTFTSTLDGLRKIARNEGIWTLWRGLSPTLMMALPGNVIYFAGYEWLRQSPHSPMAGKFSDAYAPLVAGSVARVAAAVVVSPIEMLRTRMQATPTAGRGAMRATIGGLQEMVSSQGYRTLWSGLTLTFWRDVPFSALYWWGYEYGRKHLSASRQHAANSAGLSPQDQLSNSALMTDSFLAGAASGAVSAFVTTPFDVGKTRQQTVMHSDMSAEQLRNLPESRSMPRFLWHIYCTEGMNGLFKGWAARSLKVAPACAIMISSYEFGKRMAMDVNEKRSSRH